MLTLQKTKSKEIKINNGKFTIIFSNKGMVTSLIFHKRELLKNLSGEPQDPDRKHSFYCDYHMYGKTINLKVHKIKIIKNTKKIIHFAFIDDTQKLGLEYHFMIKDEDSGIYSYIKAWNNSNQEFSINELRTVYRLNQKLTPIGYNGKRIGLQPSSLNMLQGKKIQDETYLMKEGSLYDSSFIYSKYDYAGYFKDTDLWGEYGKNLGLWVITHDKSYYGCGPLNQDLMIHYDAIALNYLVSEHFGKGLFKIKTNFSKVYGPWCIYLNNGSLLDASKRADKEKEQWPYKWVNDKNYPLKRYSVTGKIYSEYKHKDITVILTETNINQQTFIQQKDGYVFYTKTDKKGNFKLTQIRPGNYYLYAYENVSDDFDIHLLNKVEVKNQNLKLNVNYIKRKVETIWQIGQCTHTTWGMKFSDQLRNYNWLNLVPSDYCFFIGKSKDWYYLQNYKGIWHIYFKQKELIKNNQYYELYFSLAGTSQKDMKDKNGITINVVLNNDLRFTKSFPNDKSAYRSALESGAYHLWKIRIPANKMLINNNISIKTNGYIMYDSISLVKLIN